MVFAAFFWVFFQRMGLAVIAPELESSFELSAVELGLLGSAYFYPYALMQLPVGILVDAAGARRILTAFIGITGAGSLLFALALDFEQALAGRMLVGFGAAAVWLASQRLFVNWYHPRRFATVNGLMNAVGNLGGLVGSLPLALAAAIVGWREIFALVAAMLLGLAALCLAIVRDQPVGPPLGEAGKGRLRGNQGPRLPIRQGLRLVGSKGQLWLLAAAMLPFVGTRFGFQSLWGGPYLTDVQRMDAAEVGTLLMVMSLSVVVAGPAIGYLSDRVFTSRKTFSVVGFSLYTLCWVPLAFATDRIPTALLYLLVIGLGSFSCFWITVFVQAKELYPVALMGTALAVVNFTSALGGATYQQAMGVVIGFFEKTGVGYPAVAYSAAFGFCLASAAVATTLVALSKEAEPGG